VYQVHNVGLLVAAADGELHSEVLVATAVREVEVGPPPLALVAVMPIVSFACPIHAQFIPKDSCTSTAAHGMCQDALCMLMPKMPLYLKSGLLDD
jgi:hypothetical protein